MRHRVVTSVAVLLFVMGLLLPALAKRLPPPKVDPSVHQGITYSADGDGKTAWIVATDASGHTLWRAKIFHVHIDPQLEEDVQWVFISAMKLQGESLLVESEKSRCYLLNLHTHHVTNTHCP